MIGRPSIDPDLMLRMLIVGHCMGIRLNGGCAMKSISISLIAGSVVSA